MNRHKLLSATMIALATLASGAATAAEPPPRPAEYEVPFSAPQNFIDHALQALHSSFDRPGELPAPHTALR